MRTYRFLAAVALLVPAAGLAADYDDDDDDQGHNVTWIEHSGRFQQTESSNDGNAHLNLNVNVQNTDYFRGAFAGVAGGLDDYAVAIDPALAFTLFDQGDVSAVRFNLVLGVENRVSGAAPFGAQADGPRIWYRANPYVGGVFEVGPGLRLGAVYTAYTSPNGVFDTRQEVALSAGYGNNRGVLGRLQPYAMFAMQLDEGPDDSQGSYAEAGFRPQFDLGDTGMGEFQIEAPILAGVALDDYYGDTTDNYPLFVRAGLQGSVGLGMENSDYGTWRLIAGADMLWRENSMTELTFNRNGGAVVPVDDGGNNYVWTGLLGLDIAY